jgi:phage portal protein BeeE
LFESVKKFFSARPKNIPAPTAEQTNSDWFSRIGNRVSRRFRTYGLNTAKQKQLRQLSRNGIVRRGIERIKKGVLNLDYRIDAKGKVNAKQLEQIKLVINNILENPNIRHDYRSFWDMVLEDLIVLDAGVFNKVKGGNPMRPLFLYPVDGTTMEILEPYDFVNPDGDVYAQNASWLGQEKRFSTHEIAYLQMNHFTDTPYGLSPIEKLWRYLNYFLDALDNAADTASNDTPKFMISFEGVDINNTTLKAYREYMVNEIEGTSHIPIVGGKVNAVQIGAINSDSLFLEWQKFLLTLVAKCFDLPESFFITSDVNDRNTLDQQQQQVTQEAVKPYADLIEKAINEHILKELGYYNVTVQFVYEETATQKKEKSDRIGKEYTLGIITQRQALTELGYAIVENKYIDMTSKEATAAMNVDYPANNGGFKGQGDSANGWANKPTTNKTD